MKRSLALLASVLVLSCFDGPTAGEVTLSLETLRSDDGAVAFKVTIPSPDEITGASGACGGCEVFYTLVSATELRGIVTGDLSPGPVVRLAVAQGGPTHAYRAEVLSVASRGFADRPATGYYLTVQP